VFVSILSFSVLEVLGLELRALCLLGGAQLLDPSVLLKYHYGLDEFSSYPNSY
jgi:hypothetical protein